MYSIKILETGLPVAKTLINIITILEGKWSKEKEPVDIEFN